MKKNSLVKASDWHNPDNLETAGEPPWRFCLPGERIYAGDQWWCEAGKEWLETACNDFVLESHLNTYRTKRPLPAPQPGGGGEARCSTCGGLREENGGCSNSFHIPRPAPIALPVRSGEWEYSRYRATLKRNGEFFALVTSNGKDALSEEDAATLTAALNSPRSETEGRDKERLDWLESNKDYALGMPSKKDPAWYIFRDGDVSQDIVGPSLRAVIDAALAHEPEAGE